MTSDRVPCVQCAIPLPPAAKYCRQCGVSQSEPVPNSFYPLPKVVAKEKPAPAEQAPSPALVEGTRQEPELGASNPELASASVRAPEPGLDLPVAPQPVPEPEPEPEPAMKCHTCGDDLPHSLQSCFHRSPWLSDRVVLRMDRARQAASAAQAHVAQLETRLRMRAR